MRQTESNKTKTQRGIRGAERINMSLTSTFRKILDRLLASSKQQQRRDSIEPEVLLCGGERKDNPELKIKICSKRFSD